MLRSKPSLFLLLALVFALNLAETGADSYQLLELELVEPSLFLLHAPEAAEQFADALVSFSLRVG